MSKITAAITAVGGYVPDYVLTNQILETMVDTSDEWITARTGIKERRILKEKGKGTSYLAIREIEDLLKKSNTDPIDIDMVIMATATPDMPVAVTAFSFDLVAACSSFLFGMSTAAKYIESGRYKKILLIGADKMSSIIDYEDRTTCIIFGDGGGAVLFEPNHEVLGILHEILHTDGAGRPFLRIDAGGSILPASAETVANKQHFVVQEGRTIFKLAVSNMADVSMIIMKRNRLSGDDVNWLVPHQTNKRIIDATAKRMNLPEEKVMTNIHKYGNTTSATLPLCLKDYEKQLKKGDNLIFSTFSGGYTWGSIYLKWA